MNQNNPLKNLCQILITGKTPRTLAEINELPVNAPCNLTEADMATEPEVRKCFGRLFIVQDGRWVAVKSEGISRLKELIESIERELDEEAVG